MITYQARFVLKLSAFGLSISSIFLAQNSVAQVSTYNPPRNPPAYSNSNGNCQLGARNCTQQRLWNLPGYGGQPHRPNNKTQQLIESSKCPSLINFSSHWQSPFSVIQDHGGCDPVCRHSTLRSRPSDSLDRLAYLKLLPNIRTDNGHCGPGCDGFGYLGSSQAFLNNATTAPRYFHPGQQLQPTNAMPTPNQQTRPQISPNQTPVQAQSRFIFK